MADTAFARAIETNRQTAEAPVATDGITTDASMLEIRLRGGFVTKAELTSPGTGRRIGLLYAEQDLRHPKLVASHDMLPAGPYEGLGGQHGFARWADYEAVALPDDADDTRRIILQTVPQNEHLTLTKQYGLTKERLDAHTTVSNQSGTAVRTSLGHHWYFRLEDERFDGLRINGRTLDELFGADAEARIQRQDTIKWNAYGGDAVISFPAGHEIRLSAAFDGESTYPPALWIWHRADSPSICFEPVVGTDAAGGNDHVTIPSDTSATLSSTIELL